MVEIFIQRGSGRITKSQIEVAVLVIVSPGHSHPRTSVRQRSRRYINKDIIRGLFRRLEALRDNLDILLIETTNAISLLSNYLGVAMSPKPNVTTLKRIELFTHRANKISAIIFTDEGLIKNKIISTDLDVTQKDLSRIAGYLNSELSGYTFDEIRQKIPLCVNKDRLVIRIKKYKASS